MPNSSNKTKDSQKPNHQRQNKSMQNMLEKLKEFELAFYLCPELTDSQTDLLIRKFRRIVKGSGFLMYTKK